MFTKRLDISLKVWCDASGLGVVEWRYQGSAPRTHVIIVDITVANEATLPSVARVEAVLFNANHPVGSFIQECLWGSGGATWLGDVPINTSDYIKAACYNASYGALDSLNVKIAIVEEYD